MCNFLMNYSVTALTLHLISPYFDLVFRFVSDVISQQCVVSNNKLSVYPFKYVLKIYYNI